jgi:hypothetical protein
VATRTRNPLTGASTTTNAGRSKAADSRERARAKEQWARTILENDPTVTTMGEARERANEMEKETTDFRSGVEEKLIDPKTGEPTRRARRRRAATRNPSQSRGRKSSGRAPASRKQSFVRQTARTVTAPFGSGVSAGWTLFQGGLSLVLLYVVMRDADALGDMANGVASGIRRFADPYTPLLPRANETPAPGRSRTSLAAPKRKQKPGGRRSGHSRGGLPGPGSPNDPRIRR